MSGHRGGGRERSKNNDFFGSTRDHRDKDADRGDKQPFRRAARGKGAHKGEADVDNLASGVASMQILTRDRPHVITDNENPVVSSVLASPRRQIASNAENPKKVLSSAASTKPLVSPLTQPLSDGVRLIGEHLDFFDIINEYLSDTNTNYTVIGALGSQGVGKSTLLSMLGGNEPYDMYRQYIFRPSSREAIESSRFQTSSVYIYVTKSRMILIDCQAINSGAILDEAIRLNKAVKLDERLETTKYMETLQVVAFMLHVCHTVLLCVDWFIDFELIKSIRTAEMLRANIPQIANQLGLPSLSTTRKVNVVVIHARARAADFHLPTKRMRLNMLRAMFADSPRLKVVSNDDIAYFPTDEIKLRKDTAHQLQYAAHNAHNNIVVNDDDENKSYEQNMVVVFEESLRKMRPLIVGLEKEEYTVDGVPITERQWFRMAKAVFADSTFNNAAAKLASFY